MAGWAGKPVFKGESYQVDSLENCQQPPKQKGFFIAMKKPYIELLKDPRWQKKRLKILERDNFTCRCGDSESTLHIHHRWYQGLPWEAPDEALETLCESCHKSETEEMAECRNVALLCLQKALPDAGSIQHIVYSLECLSEKIPPRKIFSALCDLIQDLEESQI